MKRLILFLLLFVAACEGPVGPEGPPGLRGEQGIPGPGAFEYYRAEKDYLDEKGEARHVFEGRSLENTIVACYLSSGGWNRTCRGSCPEDENDLDGVIGLSERWVQVGLDTIEREHDQLSGNTITRRYDANKCVVEERRKRALNGPWQYQLRVTFYGAANRKYLIIAMGTATE